MLELKIGIALGSLRLPLRQALHAARRLGAAAVEIDARNDLPAGEITQTALRQIRKEMADLGLRAAALAFPTRRGYDDPEKLDRRIEGTKRAMELAYQLGAPVVVNHVGRAPRGEATAPLLREALVDLGRHGQRVGALLAAETGGDDPADLARLVASLPNGYLAIDYDPASLLLGGHDPVAALRILGPYVLHVHLRDAVNDARPGQGAETSLGRGVVDLPAVLGGLEEQGYRGFLTLRRQSAANPEAEFALACSYLRNLWS